MRELNSTGYYRLREQRERELADAAVNPKIAAIHRDMASRYSDLIMLSSAKSGDAPHPEL